MIRDECKNDGRNVMVGKKGMVWYDREVIIIS